MEDGKVAFLDFGMTGNLAAETRGNKRYVPGWRDGISEKGYFALYCFVEIFREIGGIDSHVDTKSLKTHMKFFE